MNTHTFRLERARLLKLDVTYVLHCEQFVIFSVCLFSLTRDVNRDDKWLTKRSLAQQ